MLEAPVAGRVLVMFTDNLVGLRLRGGREMIGRAPQHGIGTLARFRVTFAKEVLGLRFPIASVEVRHARDADRARRAAELMFSRHYGMDWRMRADVEEVKAV